MERSGRWVLAAGPLWFLAAPLAVPFHVLVVQFLVTFQCGATWLFTAGAAAQNDAALKRWAWLLRAVTTLGVPIALLSSLGYRGWLLAELAVRSAYLARWARLKGKQEPRLFTLCALGCALGAAFVGANLLSRWRADTLVLDSTSSRVAAIAALPFVALSWWLHAQLVTRDPRHERVPWWGHVAGGSIQLSLASAVTLAGLIGGFALSWGSPGTQPGTTYALMLGGVLLSTAAYLGAHYKLTQRSTWHRAIAICAVIQAPLVWAVVFRTEFDAGRWRRFASEQGARDGDMAQDLAYSGVVVGKSPVELEALLGPPYGRDDSPAPTDPSPGYYSYGLKDQRPCPALNIEFEHGRATGARFFRCE